MFEITGETENAKSNLSEAEYRSKSTKNCADLTKVKVSAYHHHSPFKTTPNSTTIGKIVGKK
jgi:hypothetical protein